MKMDASTECQFSPCARGLSLEPQFVVTSAVSDQYRFKDELRQFPLTSTRVNQEHKSKRRSGHELVCNSLEE